MPHQPPQRCFVEFAVAKRRDERQPQALQGTIEGQSLVHLLGGLSRRRDNKKPRPDGGVLRIGREREVYRARRSPVPGRGPFFDSAVCTKS